MPEELKTKHKITKSAVKKMTKDNALLAYTVGCSLCSLFLPEPLSGPLATRLLSLCLLIRLSACTSGSWIHRSITMLHILPRRSPSAVVVFGPLDPILCCLIVDSASDAVPSSTSSLTALNSHAWQPQSSSPADPRACQHAGLHQLG